MKAKNWLLSIMLIMACFCFFGCKDGEVAVDSVLFTEQSISLLVGEEYSPQVKILPSYATDRSYTLISDDTTALTVDGGTITAVKAVRGVRLKVVSNDNGNANDIILVNIYDEPIDLKTPTNLSFNGDAISFVAQDNLGVQSYELKVAGKIINIGNNTNYDFDNLLGKIDSSLLYNREVSCSVRAIGDGKVFKASDFSQEIKFVKLSQVSEAYVRNEMLYFNGIAGVANYTVDVLVGGKLNSSITVNNVGLETKQISVDIGQLTDSVNGASYILSIKPNVDSYSNLDVDVYSGEAVNVKYNVLAKVTNLAINNRVISWDFVENASTYTAKLYKGGVVLREYQNITSNYIEILDEDAGYYGCEVIANSSANNTTTGKRYSDQLNFTILSAPVITADENIISWSEVANVEGYLVTIKNAKGDAVVSGKFVIGTNYDVSQYNAGKYTIEVASYGNGDNILTSVYSATTDWTVLNAVQLNIENKVLYWADVDSSSKHKYHVQFNTGNSEIDLELTEEDYSAGIYGYDEIKEKYFFNLDGYDFEPNTYTLSVQSLGEGPVFDADVNTTKLIKLADAKINSLSDKTFAIDTVASGIRYELKVYRAGDADLTQPLENVVFGTGSSFAVNASDLTAGDYVAKVFVYGNNLEIFDAENETSDTSTMPFSKLETPSLDVNKSNVTLEWSGVNKAESYKLYQGENAQTFTHETDKTDKYKFSVSNLTAGVYEYKIQAVGNKKDVLDSDIASSPVSVKKLLAPQISFDKNSQIYTMSYLNKSDEEFVGEYIFSINGEGVDVDSNGTVDCSSKFVEAGTYSVIVYANPINEAGTDYDLIMPSCQSTHTASKLAGATSFVISNGKLLVTGGNLVEPGYSLSVRIDFGVERDKTDDITLTGFTYSADGYSLNLYDSDYNPMNEHAEALLNHPLSYNLYTTVSKNDATVVSSTENLLDVNLAVLERVSTINKSGQSIEFNAVDAASGYVAIVELRGREHQIELTSEHYNVKAGASQDVNSLSMEMLVGLMPSAQPTLQYVEGELYKISFVAVSNASNYMANRGTTTYQFEFLRAPAVSVVEKTGANTKYVKILNNNDKVSAYDVVISQDTVNKTGMWTKTAEDATYINLDELIHNLDELKFVAGNVSISAKSKASAGNYFESTTTNITVEKIGSTSISIEDGVLTWSVVDNAKQYNLVYVTGGVESVKPLKSGVENFSVSGDKCTYDFAKFDTNNIKNLNLYLQIDSILNSGSNYYINSNNGETLENVYKLPTLPINVVEGKLVTEIDTADLIKTSSVELLINDKNTNIDITKEQEYITINSTLIKSTITIDPIILLDYGVTELKEESIKIKLYSKDSSTLNSSVASKTVKGLLKPSDLNIITAEHEVKEGVIDEVFEKISWTNPTANTYDAGNQLTYVSNYEIVMTYSKYEGVTFKFYDTTTTFMMPTDYDLNGNGTIEDDEKDIFGAGVYTIKVRALTNNDEDVVNSAYCDSISITVLETPTALQTENGNVIWSSDTQAEYYSARIYKLDKANGNELILSTRADTNSIDLSNFAPLETGVYGITIQSRNSNSKILASKESEMLQIIRLPQVQSYFIKDGDLYINVHKFFTKAEIYLTTTRAENNVTHKFEIINNDLGEYSRLVGEMQNNGSNWIDTDILSTYSNDSYYVPAKYVGKGGSVDGTLLKALSENHTVTVKLFGNTAILGAIVSGHTSTPTNSNFGGVNSVEKLITPTVKVSETEQGVVVVKIPEGTTYESIKYYDNGASALRGVYLYDVTIKAGDEYQLYVAQIFDLDLLNASLDAVESELITDASGLIYFKYGEKTFNVVNGTDTSKTELKFNFKAESYSYYTISGLYSDFNLSLGGDFRLTCRLMGDDTKYAKSNITPEAVIKRYDPLKLSVGDGVISWKNIASDVDEPIYVITLTQGSGADKKEYYLALYNSEYNLDDVKAGLNDGRSYVYDTINYIATGEYRDGTITYSRLADKIYELTGSSNGGSYSVSIMAYSIDSTATDKIRAQSAEPVTVASLAKTDISVSNGKLGWNLVKIINSDGSGYEYVYNYKLEVLNNSGDVVYTMNLNNGEGQELDSDLTTIYSVGSDVSKAVYNVNEILKNGQDDGYKMVAGNTYKFRLTTMAKADSTTYVNSVSSVIDNVSILPNLTEVRMEDGLLKWNTAESSVVEIYIKYIIPGYTDHNGNAVPATAVEWTPEVSGSSFDLPTEWIVDDGGTSRQLVSGYDYEIRARLLGNSTVLNGFYVDMVNADFGKTTQRLATIANNISTNKGVLTWGQITGPYAEEKTQYQVHYTLSDGTIGNTGLLDDAEFDFANLASGAIKATITAHHNNYFTSKPSAEIELTKLIAPDEKTIKYNGPNSDNPHTISWDKVKLGKTEIDNYYISIMVDDKVVHTELCNKNIWKISDKITSNTFMIAIRAVSVDTNGDVINSDYTEYQTIGLPEQIDTATFKFDEKLQAFVWEAPSDWASTDVYRIYYSYSVTENGIPSQSDPIEVDKYEEKTELKDGEEVIKRYYYYHPRAIGYYSLIYVQVQRAGSLLSQPTYCMEDEKTTYNLHFDLFESGDGSDNSPYIIKTEEHLRNITYFLNATYELGGKITLASSDPITTSTQVFSGTIDGKNNYIYQHSIAVSDEYPEAKTYAEAKSGEDIALGAYNGLFHNVSGAIFRNINLSQFVYKGFVSNVEKLGSGSYGNIYLGILAGKAQNTTFDSITITSSYISVTKDNNYEDDVNIHIGSVAGYASDSSFTSCKVNMADDGSTENINLYIVGTSWSEVYLGGVVGYAENGTFTNNTSGVTADGAYVNAFIVKYLFSPLTGYTTPKFYLGAVTANPNMSNEKLVTNTCYCSYGTTIENVVQTEQQEGKWINKPE